MRVGVVLLCVRFFGFWVFSEGMFPFFGYDVLLGLFLLKGGVFVGLLCKLCLNL